MNAPSISVVIPSYNRRENVLALLADVYRQEGVRFEVIVVDDCSPDGSADAIAAAYPQVTLLRNEKNGGPCVARNRGIRAAHGEIIVGLDSDVTLPDPFLLQNAQKAFLEMPHATGFAFRILQSDGVSEDHLRWWHPLPIQQFADKVFETSYFSGTAYAFRREPLLVAGLYPELLYMHYEEVVLAWRLLDQGGTILHAPHLSVLHHATPTVRRSKVKIFYQPRSQVLTTLLCYPLWRGIAWLAPRLVFALLVAIKDRHVSEFIGAMRSAWALAGDTLRLRKPLSSETWRRIANFRKATGLNLPTEEPATEGCPAAAV